MVLETPDHENNTCNNSKSKSVGEMLKLRKILTKCPRLDVLYNVSESKGLSSKLTKSIYRKKQDVKLN